MSDQGPRDRIWQEFLAVWPRERLKTLTLTDYCGPGEETLVAWVDTKTTLLGRLPEGTSARWGVVHRGGAPAPAAVQGLRSDAVHDWRADLGDSPEAAFARLRGALVSIADAAATGRLADIDRIDEYLAPTRWKLAFLYQDRAAPSIVPVFDDATLRGALEILDPGAAQKHANAPMSALYGALTLVLRGLDDPPFSAGDLVLHASMFPWLREIPVDARVWEIAAGERGAQAPWWLRDGLVSVGWSMGDLTGASEDEFLAKAILNHGEKAAKRNHGIWQLWKFQTEMQKGDVVLARKANEHIFAIGLIEGDCLFDSTFEKRYPHDHPYIRRVSWLSRDTEFAYPWKTQQTIVAPGSRTRLHVLKLLALSIGPGATNRGTEPVPGPTNSQPARNTILVGPPGTGKTWSLKSRAAAILGQKSSGVVPQGRESASRQWNEAVLKGRGEFVTFHPSTTYDEFIEGLRPVPTTGDGIEYGVEAGVFKRIALRAVAACAEGAAELASLAEQEALGQQLLDENCPLDFSDAPNFVLVIDEINRANISRVFGELITLLEDDKRLGGGDELRLILPSSRHVFAIPPNLYVIGTMNTADRSIALLDVALRRRFAFEELLPCEETLGKMLAATTKPAFRTDVLRVFRVLNERLAFMLDRDHVVGHAWFGRASSWEALREIFALKVIPLLREYFAGAPERMAIALGERYSKEDQRLVDCDRREHNFFCVRTIQEAEAFGREFPDLDAVQEISIHPLFDGRGDFEPPESAPAVSREDWIRLTFAKAFSSDASA